MIAAHIITAILALVLSLLALLRPSQALVRFGATASLLTVISGGLLLIQQPATLGRVCISGVIFIAVSFLSLRAAARRLSTLGLQKI